MRALRESQEWLSWQAAGKKPCSVILSEAKNLSLFLFFYFNRREILRFAQNDRGLSFPGRVARALRDFEFVGAPFSPRFTENVHRERRGRGFYRLDPNPYHDESNQEPALEDRQGRGTRRSAGRQKKRAPANSGRP
jgi:hypothetical protein